MSKILNQLSPQPLWDIFESVCQVPRPSKHEEKIQAWVLNFAKEHGIEAFQDKAGNVILRKPATPGYESLTPVILQSHLDMVPQKNSDVVHNFLTDPIKPRIDGEWVKATGTTLGADNGIGMSASLAVMVSENVKHGPIECLITFDEETGMTGAFELEKGVLKGEILINLDSEEFGEIFIGCAGGCNTIAKIKINQLSADKSAAAFKVNVKGLKGGHSGMDIHLGRGNANKVINRLLWIANKKFNLNIASVEGGTLRNAIPREAFAVVTVAASEKDDFIKFVNEYSAIVKNELATTDSSVIISAEPCNMPDTVMDKTGMNNYLSAVYACPNGVYGMSADMPGLVETSNNIAIVKSDAEYVTVETLQRSSVDSQKDDIGNTITAAFELAGAEVELSGSYPGWKPNVHSAILQTMLKVYENKYGAEPKIQSVHAGLECGLLGKVYPNWDMISFGPTIRSPHSPDERVNIESVKKFWDYLIDTLQNIPKK